MPTTESCRGGAAERRKRALYFETTGYVFNQNRPDCPEGSISTSVPSRWLYNFESPTGTYTRGAWWNGSSYNDTGPSSRSWSYPVRSPLRSLPRILLVTEEGGTYLSTLHFGGGLKGGPTVGERLQRATVGLGWRSLYVSAEYWHPNENRWRWARWTQPEEHSRDGDRNYVGQFGIADFFGPSNPELFVKANDLCAFTGGVHAGVAAATTLDLNIVVKVEGGKSLQLAAPGGAGFAAYTDGFDLCDAAAVGSSSKP